ncbi:MAG TPA: MerR family transcriptional regulator [Clostridia bacterium]|nr:MerR family transcriptional regulator [Clostridia bacterium]
MTIGQVSKQYGLSQDTLRYYERIGLIPSVRRSSSGIRDYAQEDCNWIDFIKCLRCAGLPIEVLTEYVALFQTGDTTVAARKKLLIEQRKQLSAKIEAMQKTMERLNAKIESYEQIVVKKEKQLKPF